MSKMIVFDLTEPMMTSDNYFVKLKGFVEADTQHDRDQLISAVKKSCKRHLSSITLMEALDLVNPDHAKDIIDGLAEVSTSITKLEISTVDAVEKATSNVNLDIDPALEGRQQKKGLFGRMKGLFKK